MVSIIIASHGDFANGILQSAQMIFGEQEAVQTCTLLPSEGPEDIKRKMQEAIDSFENQDEVLFLVDLFSGTPFNQANMLIEGHKDKWAIISGMNLSLLIEVFGARLTSESAHEIASQVLEEAVNGIKIIPSELEPKKVEEKSNSNDQQFSGNKIPEGTVIGDGKIKYVLARIDTRLLHGQVATSWTKTTSPNRIIVVSDKVSKDELRKSMIEQAAPPGVKAHVVPISKMIQVDKDPRFGNTKALLLFENLEEVLTAIENGLELKNINLGSIAHTEGKVAVTRALSMDYKDIEIIEKLLEKGIKIDVRKVPADSPENLDEILKKAKKELANKSKK